MRRDKIIFVDGECVICNRLVEFLLKVPGLEDHQFSSIKSSILSKVLDQHPITHRPDSVVYLKGDEIYIKSRAIGKILLSSNAWYRPMALLILATPRKIADYFYDVIAKNRYAWFGKRSEDFCEMPSAADRARFID